VLTSIFDSMNKLPEKTVLLLVVAGTIFITTLHHTMCVSTTQFIFAEITLVLALIALLLSRGNGEGMLSIGLPVPLWILPAIVYLVGQIEVVHLRRTEVFYLVTLATALILTAISAESHVNKLQWQ